MNNSNTTLLYQLLGDAVYLPEYGALLNRKNIQAILQIPQKDSPTIALRFIVQGLAPLDIMVEVASLQKHLQELFVWLSGIAQNQEKTVQLQAEEQLIAKEKPIPDTLDEFGLPDSPQTKEELDMILKASQSFQNTMDMFNRPQPSPPLEESKPITEDHNKRVFNPHMFDLSD